MTRLSDILDTRLLDEMIEGGYVRTQDHPALPLRIYNYTEKAQYDDVWNEVTLQCRGLIADTSTFAIAARPFRKFFNHGQVGAPLVDVREPVIATDKLDGSMGCLYPTPDGHAIATRGSFSSDQALHATEVWQEQYADVAVPPIETWVFEIIFPSNRIVVDYGTMDDLVLLGAINKASGQWMSPDSVGGEWPGPKARLFPHRTLADALAAPPRENAEGLVVHFPRLDERVKIKQDDYVALHRIVTGLNARTVWQHIVDGKVWEEMLDGLPDEFHGFVQEVQKHLEQGVIDAVVEIENEYDYLITELPKGFTRKDFADRAKRSTNAWALFMKLDGRDILPSLWKNAKPEAFWTPSGRTYSEDVA